MALLPVNVKFVSYTELCDYEKMLAEVARAQEEAKQLVNVDEVNFCALLVTLTEAHETAAKLKAEIAKFDAERRQMVHTIFANVTNPPPSASTWTADDKLGFLAVHADVVQRFRAKEANDYLQIHKLASTANTVMRVVTEHMAKAKQEHQTNTAAAPALEPTA